MYLTQHRTVTCKQLVLLMLAVIAMQTLVESMSCSKAYKKFCSKDKQCVARMKKTFADCKRLKDREQCVASKCKKAADMLQANENGKKFDKCRCLGDNVTNCEQILFLFAKCGVVQGKHE